MKPAIAFIIFLFFLIIERSFLQNFTGFFIPFSFWAAGVCYLFLERVNILFFAFAAGLITAFLSMSVFAETFTLFAATGLTFFITRRFFEGEGTVREVIGLASAVYSFQFLQLPIGMFFGGGHFLTNGFFVSDFLLNACFIFAASIIFIVIRNRKIDKMMEYV